MSSVYQAKTGSKSKAGLMNAILQTVTRWKPIIHLHVIKDTHPNQNLGLQTHVTLNNNYE